MLPCLPEKILTYFDLPSFVGNNKKKVMVSNLYSAYMQTS